MAIKGLTQEETDALRVILMFTVKKGSGNAKVRRFLDGDREALRHAPGLRKLIENAETVIANATR